MAKNRKFDGNGVEYYKHYNLNKYFNLFVDSFDWKGLTYREVKYIMRKFWNDGTICAFKIKNLNKIAFAPWVRDSWDLYGEPETVTLINERGSSLIPSTTQVVDKDVVIGWVQANEKGIYESVKFYIDRIANIEAVLNTNLNLQKMPFIIPVEKEDVQKIYDLITRILNNDVAIVAEDIDPSMFKAVATQAPYIIDKLYNYKQSLENELKTLLGINNNGKEKEEQLQMAEVNANNDEINAHQNGYLDHLKDFCKRIKETLGIEINVECNREQAKADGQIHNGDKPGAKEGEEDEE